MVWARTLCDMPQISLMKQVKENQRNTQYIKRITSNYFLYIYLKNLILYLNHLVKHHLANLANFSTLFHDHDKSSKYNKTI